MQEETKYIKLPFIFNTTRLKKDLETALQHKWVLHFNTSNYSGDWKAISLYAVNGDSSNIFALQTENSEVIETQVLKTCNYFKTCIDTIKCKVLSARLLKLAAGAEIKPHKDNNLGYCDNTFRIHIPITTNSNVYFKLDHKHLPMLPGECWYTNVNYIHSVSNKGNTDRIHLVIDYERNKWSDNVFFSLAPKESFLTSAKEDYNVETLKNIIAQLDHVKAPATAQLIKDLKTQLKSKQNL